MLGVLVNTILVIIGSILGIILKKRFSEKMSKSIMMGLGVCTAYIGIKGAMCGENVLIMIVSMVLGAAAGTGIDIDRLLNIFGESIQKKLNKSSENSSIAEGFVSGTLLFCVGAMTVTGSIQAGIAGDNTILFTKATIDFVASMVLASGLGAGVLLAAGSVFFIQGGIVCLSELLVPVLSEAVINEMTCVGSLMIIMIGTNMAGITKFKTANYLPAIIIARQSQILCKVY